MKGPYHLINRQFLSSLTAMKLRGITLLTKFVLTLFIAKILGLEALGLYGFITGATIVLPVVLGLGLMHSPVRNAVFEMPSEIVVTLKYFLRYILFVYALVLVASVLFAYSTDGRIIYALVVLLVFFEHLNNTLYQLLLNLSKPVQANLLLFIRSALWVGLYVPAVLFLPDLKSLDVLILAWLLGNVAAFAGFLIAARKWPWFAKSEMSPLFSWIGSSFKVSRTIYMNGLVGAVSSYLDRYLIGIFLGLEMSGVYVLFWSINSALLNLLRSGVIQNYRPRFVRAFKEQTGSYRSLYKSCFKNSMIIAMLFALSAGTGFYYILPFLNKPLASEWYPILWGLLAGFALAVWTEVQDLVFYSQKADHYTLKASLVGGVASVVLNVGLIPILGLWGATGALCTAILVKIAMQKIWLSKLLRAELPHKENG